MTNRHHLIPVPIVVHVVEREDGSRRAIGWYINVTLDNADELSHLAVEYIDDAMGRHEPVEVDGA